IGAKSSTINLSVGWGEAGGQTMSPFALGQSLTNAESHSYADLKSVISYLPADATNGAGTFWVSSAQAKALGFATTSTSDGAVGFASGVPWDLTGSVSAGSGVYDFQAVAMHELTRRMGRMSV